MKGELTLHVAPNTWHQLIAASIVRLLYYILPAPLNQLARLPAFAGDHGFITGPTRLSLETRRHADCPGLQTGVDTDRPEDMPSAGDD